MKGADQCPRCASRRWGEGEQAITGFYGRVLRVCVNCATTWEPFDPADLSCDGRRLDAFKEPCDNCAFRPGSVEQQDVEEWKKTIASLKAGGAFYCHKGVPLDLKHEHGDTGFAYPDQGRDWRKLRLCRGYLNTLNKRFAALLPETD